MEEEREQKETSVLIRGTLWRNSLLQVPKIAYLKLFCVSFGVLCWRRHSFRAKLSLTCVVGERKSLEFLLSSRVSTNLD